MADIFAYYKAKISCINIFLLILGVAFFAVYEGLDTLDHKAFSTQYITYSTVIVLWRAWFGYNWRAHTTQYSMKDNNTSLHVETCVVLVINGREPPGS